MTAMQEQMQERMTAMKEEIQEQMRKQMSNMQEMMLKTLEGILPVSQNHGNSCNTNVGQTTGNSYMHAREMSYYRDLYKGTCKSTKKPSDRRFIYMS